MFSKEVIQSKLAELTREFGEWTYDIPLPHNVWTKGNLNVPHTRLKRLVQIVNDVCCKPISQCRILDLGCLEGMFAIEFALHGAETIGMDVREANLKKAIFCKEVLDLPNLNFVQADIRDLTPATLGTFDVILCSGILYHLAAKEVISCVEMMFHTVKQLLILDTHVALEPVERVFQNGFEYFGRSIREHSEDATPEQRAQKLLASWENPVSFWFTRPSLLNLLHNTGFSSVYECFIPAHLNFGKPGIEHQDRCTFVAMKGKTQDLYTSPSANRIVQEWPQNSLAYAPPKDVRHASLATRIGKGFRRFLKSKKR